MACCLLLVPCAPLSIVSHLVTSSLFQCDTCVPLVVSLLILLVSVVLCWSVVFHCVVLLTDTVLRLPVFPLRGDFCHFVHFMIKRNQSLALESSSLSSRILTNTCCCMNRTIVNHNPLTVWELSTKICYERRNKINKYMRVRKHNPLFHLAVIPLLIRDMSRCSCKSLHWSCPVCF